jgi:putative ABC transport system ATP-binding protein
LRNRIGYLFQNFALIDDLSVYDNLKIVLKKSSKKEKMILIQQALEKVGLKDVINKKIYQLSGGEQQRVSVARLILQESDIILADEPTGSLDRKNALIIIKLLEKFHSEGKTIIMVSHDENLFKNCSRIINL